MARGQRFFLQFFLNGGLQLQQPQGVGDGAAGFADALGGLLLGHVVLLGQGLIPHGLLHGIQVLPLEVLDHGQLGGLPVVGLDDRHRHLLQACQPGSTPAAFAGNDLIVPGGQLPHGQRLDDAVFPDGIRQLGQRLLVKVLPGLGGIALHF